MILISDVFVRFDFLIVFYGVSCIPQSSLLIYLNIQKRKMILLHVCDIIVDVVKYISYFVNLTLIIEARNH